MNLPMVHCLNWTRHGSQQKNCILRRPLQMPPQLPIRKTFPKMAQRLCLKTLNPPLTKINFVSSMMSHPRLALVLHKDGMTSKNVLLPQVLLLLVVASQLLQLRCPKALVVRREHVNQSRN